MKIYMITITHRVHFRAEYIRIFAMLFTINLYNRTIDNLYNYANCINVRFTRNIIVTLKFSS